MAESNTAFLGSPEVRSNLQAGKYSSWVTRLNAEQLIAIFYAVGEFGTRFAEMRLQDGTFPVAGEQTQQMPLSRVVRALESFAILRTEGRYRHAFPSGWDQCFSSTRPAFSEKFRHRLSVDPDTSWLAEVDERSFALIVWMIGEMTIRLAPDFWLTYPTSNVGPTLFSKEHRNTGPMCAALYVMSLVRAGELGSKEEARQILARASVDP